MHQFVEFVRCVLGVLLIGVIVTGAGMLGNWAEFRAPAWIRARVKTACIIIIVIGAVLMLLVIGLVFPSDN